MLNKRLIWCVSNPLVRRVGYIYSYLFHNLRHLVHWRLYYFFLFTCIIITCVMLRLMTVFLSNVLIHLQPLGPVSNYVYGALCYSHVLGYCNNLSIKAFYLFGIFQYRHPIRHLDRNCGCFICNCSREAGVYNKVWDIVRPCRKIATWMSNNCLKLAI